MRIIYRHKDITVDTERRGGKCTWLLGTPPMLLQKVALDIRGKKTTGKAKNNLDKDSGERTQVHAPYHQEWNSIGGTRLPTLNRDCQGLYASHGATRRSDESTIHQKNWRNYCDIVLIFQNWEPGRDTKLTRVHTCIDHSVVTLHYLLLVSVLKSADKLTSCGV